MMTTPGFSDIHIEGATFCDARCICCPHGDMKRSGVMDWKLFTSIVDESLQLGCQHFIPFRVNEPFLDPHIFDRLQYFREAGTPSVDIFTNGHSLTARNVERLITYRDVVDSITFSFHGGTPEAYNLNTGLDFDTVYNNIVNFAHANPGIITHIYCLHWSTTKDTETEFMKLWEGVDVDSVTVRASMEWGGDREDECTVSAETKGREDVHRIPCPRVLYQVDVMVDGTVPLCCVDGHGKVTFGNLNEESIVEMWHSDKRIYYREMHESLQFDKLELCADCSVNIRDGRK